MNMVEKSAREGTSDNGSPDDGQNKLDTHRRSTYYKNRDVSGTSEPTEDNTSRKFRDNNNNQIHENLALSRHHDRKNVMKQLGSKLGESHNHGSDSADGSHGITDASKPISRQRRTLKQRRLNTANEFYGDYAHDGDIDHNDIDEADNDSYSDNHQNINASDEDTDSGLEPIGSDRHKQTISSFLRLRTSAQKSKAYHEDLKFHKVHTASDISVDRCRDSCLQLEHNAGGPFCQSSLSRAASIFANLLSPFNSRETGDLGVGKCSPPTSKHIPELNHNYKFHSTSGSEQQHKQQQPHSPGQTATTMPSSSSNNKYQTLRGYNEHRPSSRRSSSRSKTRESQRLIDSNGYSRLSQQHHKRSSKQSVSQAYASMTDFGDI